MPRKGTKKITPERFKEIRSTHSTNLKRENGDDKKALQRTADEFGYTVASVKRVTKAKDFTSWDLARKPRKPSTPPAAPVKPQAIQPVAPSQSVTKRRGDKLETIAPMQIKKPGHAAWAAAQQSASHRPVVQRGQDQIFVTREQHDRDMRNHAQLINRVNEQLVKIGKEVAYLTREDTAYKQAEIAIVDRASKSRLTKFREWLSRGRS